jgi:hypothetical protein
MILASLLPYFLCFAPQLIEAFCPSSRLPLRQLVITHAAGFAKSPNAHQDDDDAPSPSPTTKPKGDSIRSTTGIRPSLHPVTINCIADALLQRSKPSNDGTNSVIDIAQSQKPIETAILAGSIAMNAIQQRQSASLLDETTDSFTMEESNVISGRVVGVVMRMRELEHQLRSKVGKADYVWKYGEEMNYGLLKQECNVDTIQLNHELEKTLGDNLKMNPLLRMNRAECLLALFIETVEKPKLEMVGEEVPGGSLVDFIDGDRLEVLFKE